MPVINAFGHTTGTIGNLPNLIYIQTNDTPATVVTAGYLTHAVQEGLLQAPTNTDLAVVSTITAGVTSCFIYSVVVTGTADNRSYSLSTAVSGGQIFAGNVQAGMNGIPGHFISFPAGANLGNFSFTAANQGGNFASSLTNAAFGQATAITIPDPGVAAANVLLTQSAGTQTIATGNLALTIGTLTLGSNGHASSLTLFPGTAANGTFIISPLNAGGAFNTTLRNSVMGQSTVFSLPDPASATGRILTAGAALVNGNMIVSSGVAGQVADAGYAIKTVAQAAVAGGAAAQVVVDAFVTAASNIVAVWNDTTNAVTIQKVAAGVGQFTVTSSGDPGASHLNYIVTK